MDLNKIENEGKWSEQTTRLNSNFNKINQETESLKSTYKALTQSAVLVVSTLPAEGEAYTIYRVVGISSYSDYMYNPDDLNTPILMATYNNAIDTYPQEDSENLITSGAVYESYANQVYLDDQGEAEIPNFHPQSDSVWSHGVQEISAANQEQIRANLGFGDGDIDDVPTSNSGNVVRSGGVKSAIDVLQNNVANEIEDFENVITAQISEYEPIVINGDVTNAADEEDLTSSNGLLKLKNRNSLYGMGKIILRRNHTFAEQLTQTNTIYIIQYDFDLNGATVTIPENCVLQFEGGSLSNGTLIGQNTTVTTTTKSPCFYNIELQQTITYFYDVVPSYIFANSVSSLQQLCNLVQNKGTIELHEDVYIEDAVSINKSITIKGNGNTIFIKNEDKTSVGLFNINNTNSFCLENAVVDGGLGYWDEVYRADYNSCILCNNVGNIIIKNVSFKNLYYNQNADSPYYPYMVTDVTSEDYKKPIAENYYHWGFMGFLYFNRLVIKDCTFDNITAKEHIIAFPKNWDTLNSDSEIEIKNNIFNGDVILDDSDPSDMKYVTINSTRSSWFTVYYCKGMIANNYFGGCEGSHINAFLHDATIKNNTFKDGIRSVAVDLDEGGLLGFKPTNVIVKNNYAKTIVGGFVWCGATNNVTIQGNTLDNSLNVKNTAFASIFTGNSIEPIAGQSITFYKNNSIGDLRFLTQQYYNSSFGIINILDNNYSYEKTVYTENSVIEINGYGTVNIKNNVFHSYNQVGNSIHPIGTVGPNAPCFISTIYKMSDDMTDKNVNFNIENNVFSCITQAIIIRNNYSNFTIPQNIKLRTIGTIVIRNNSLLCETVNANNTAGIFILSGNWNEYNENTPKLIVKDNRFNKTQIVSNINYTTDTIGYDVYSSENRSNAANFAYRSEKGLKLLEVSSNINIPRIEYNVLVSSYIGVTEKRSNTNYRSGYFFLADDKICIALNNGKSSVEGTVEDLEDGFKKDGSLIYKELCDFVSIENNSNHIPVRIIPQSATKANIDRIRIGSNAKGLTVYDTTNNKQLFWNGTAWVDALGNPV